MSQAGPALLIDSNKKLNYSILAAGGRVEESDREDGRGAGRRVSEARERNEGVIGSEWHLGVGESGRQTRFSAGQSVYGNYNSLRGGGGRIDG